MNKLHIVFAAFCGLGSKVAGARCSGTSRPCCQAWMTRPAGQAGGLRGARSCSAGLTGIL